MHTVFEQETPTGGQKRSRTHLEAAVYEPNVCAGEIESPLNLSDGALYVGACQGLGEVGEGKCYYKQLKDRRGQSVYFKTHGSIKTLQDDCLKRCVALVTSRFCSLQQSFFLN